MLSHWMEQLIMQICIYKVPYVNSDPGSYSAEGKINIALCIAFISFDTDYIPIRKNS